MILIRTVNLIKYEYIDILANSQVLFMIDESCSFRQVEIEDADYKKTAFSSHNRLFRLLEMPLGLRNPPEPFQRTMDVIFLPMKRHSGLVYVHNIVMFSCNVDKNISHFRTMVLLLQKADVTLNLKKYNFFIGKIDYVRHVI